MALHLHAGLRWEILLQFFDLRGQDLLYRHLMDSPGTEILQDLYLLWKLFAEPQLSL
jgi:hypothetical protein